MRKIVVIPARYASSRFPGKPLKRDTGRYLIEHVYERAQAARLADRVLVATDDERIRSACESFGAGVCMTAASCRSGTDRVAEAVRELDCELVVNVQGDEPELDPHHIDVLFGLLEERGDGMATLASRSLDPTAFANPNVVKVTVDAEGRALYFSRSPIPYERDGGGVPRRGFLAHIGIYGYRKGFLQEVAALAAQPLEETEALEQLRVLEAGHTIRVGVVGAARSGIDTPEQYRAFVERQRRLSDPGGG